ncbi:MAG: DUF1501 domain-containing protein [Planctomycetaceae bacterium]
MTRLKRPGFCGSAEHVTRRGFLGTAAAGAAAAGFAQDMTVLDVLKNPLVAAEVKKNQKSVILLWLAGGASQLETWDPKPGRPTGGPFRPISTNATGVQISELLPKMSQRMQHTAILRSLSTGIGDHGGGASLMETGRRREQGLPFPDLGAIISRELGRADSQVPDYVSFYTSTEGRRKGTSGFLGARFAPMFLADGMIPPNIRRLEAVADIDHKERADLRDLLAKRFSQGRRSRVLGTHTSAYQRVRGIMASEQLFNIEDEPAKVRARYGPTQFAQQCLVARRLVEAGVPFVKVARAWWDSHGQNFETHQELCADLDQSMSVLLDDLHERGMLENTLVITLAEFGRTPKINPSLGRDHFANAWSATLSGCGVKGGAVHGKTDADGQNVAEGKIGAKDLFATAFKALGIDHEKEYTIGARPIPLVDFGAKLIETVLV